MGSRDSFSPAAAAPAARAARRRGRGTPRAAAPPSSLRRAAPSTASCTCGNMGNVGCEMWGHVTGGHPQHRAPSVQRGVGLAAEEEGGRRRVHRQREVEELLDARDQPARPFLPVRPPALDAVRDVARRGGALARLCRARQRAAARRGFLQGVGPLRRPRTLLCRPPTLTDKLEQATTRSRLVAKVRRPGVRAAQELGVVRLALLEPHHRPQLACGQPQHVAVGDDRGDGVEAMRSSHSVAAAFLNACKQLRASNS